MSTTGPSWEQARENRELLLFRQQTTDANGKVIRKPWPRWVHPSRIQSQSAGLGMYFKSLRYFMIVMCIFSLIAIPPLVSNIVKRHFSDHYLLVESDGMSQPLECNKDYAVGSFVLDGSLGSHCSDSPFSGKFDCPAVCTYDTTKRTSSMCAGVSISAESTCRTRPPCKTEPEDECKIAREENRVEDVVGCCECCDLEVDREELNEVPVWQAWLWCIAGAVAWELWMTALKKMQGDVAAAVNARNISSADFAVWVSHVPEFATSDHRLREYAEHYGEVAAAFQVRDVGNVLTLCSMIENTKKQLAEAEALSQQAPAAGKASCWVTFDFLYRWVVTGLFFSNKRGIERMKVRLERLEHHLREAEKAELKGTGKAIIVFTYSAHKTNLLDDHYRSTYCARTLLAPNLQRQLNILTGGLFTSAPRFHAPDAEGNMSKHFIAMQRAPEASDVWWEHAVAGHGTLVRQRVMVAVLYFALIGAICVVQYIITRAAEEERHDRIFKTREVIQDPDDTEMTLNATQLVENVKESVALRVLSMAQGLVVTLMNMSVFGIMNALTRMERHLTTTGHLTSMVGKLTLFYFLNSFVIPIVTVTTVRGADPVWYTKGGVVESGFYIQLTNAFLPDLFGVLNFIRMFKYHVLSKFARTQAYLNANLEPPPFNISLRLAIAMRTIILGVLYAPILPISPMISLVGLLISYLADQFLALHASCKPAHFDVDVLDTVNHILHVLPFVQMILIEWLYFREEALVPFACGVAIWAFLMLLPLRRITGCVWNRDFEPDGSRHVSFDTLRSLGLQGTSSRYGARYGAAYGALYLQRILADIGTTTSRKISPSFYFPSIPSHVSSCWTKMVHTSLSVYKSGPCTTLMEGQKPRTGGELATRIPTMAHKGRIQQALLAETSSLDPNITAQPVFELVDSDTSEMTKSDEDSGQGSPVGGSALPARGNAVPSAPAAMPHLLYHTGSMHISSFHKPGFYASPFLGGRHLSIGPHESAEHSGSISDESELVGPPVVADATTPMDPPVVGPHAGTPVDTPVVAKATAPSDPPEPVLMAYPAPGFGRDLLEDPVKHLVVESALPSETPTGWSPAVLAANGMQLDVAPGAERSELDEGRAGNGDAGVQ